MKVYVASSWKNTHQPEVVRALREDRHIVYDFRNPAEGQNGFGWQEIDPDWPKWDFAAYKEALIHPRSQQGFKLDFEAMRFSNACVMVLPCGRSANFELGWFAGQGKLTIVYCHRYDTPDLMYLATDYIVNKLEDVRLILSAADTANNLYRRMDERVFGHIASMLVDPPALRATPDLKPSGPPVSPEVSIGNLSAALPPIVYLSCDHPHGGLQWSVCSDGGLICHQGSQPTCERWLIENSYLPAPLSVKKMLLPDPDTHVYVKKGMFEAYT